MAGKRQKVADASEGKKSKKGKKKHYGGHARQSYSNIGIPLGAKGFLISCLGGKEFGCSREVINVLDEFWDLAAGRDDGLVKSTAATLDVKETYEESEDNETAEVIKKTDETCQQDGIITSPNIDDNITVIAAGRMSGTQAIQSKPAAGADIAKLLEQEIEGIRTLKEVRFSHVDTGCKGLAFVKMKYSLEAGPGPSQLAETVVRHILMHKQVKTRYTMKLMPAEAICYASPSEIVKAIQPIIATHFPTTSSQIKFAILLESRAHGGLDKMDIINQVASVVPSPHKVDLSHPDKTILLQVVKTACAIGVVSDYKSLMKYNLSQLTAPPKEAETPTNTEGLETSAIEENADTETAD